MEHGEWLQAGLAAHGLTLNITPDVGRPADIHIVSGPHYAKQQWLDHPRVLLLDRAYYHGEKSGRWASMDWVSLGWMTPDGSRTFRRGTGRRAPVIQDNAADEGVIFLADFDGPVEPADTVRLHPAHGKHAEGLLDALRRHRKAVGYGTTALVTAALEGLEVECKDAGHILRQPDWINLLPYADWRFNEIASGGAWEHLKYVLDDCH